MVAMMASLSASTAPVEAAAPATTAVSVGATSTHNVSGSSALYGVACTAPTACIAVGNQPSGSGTVGVVVTIANGVPGPVRTISGTSSLGGIACPTATACIAVGSVANSTGGAGVIVTITDGVRGTVQSLAGLSFSDIACPTTTGCIAVGNSGLQPIVVAITNGVAGSTQRVNVNVVGALSGVACQSGSQCIAVGWSLVCAVMCPYNTLAVPVSSGVVGPAGASYVASFADVACPSSTLCIAVGDTSPFAGAPTSAYVSPVVGSADGETIATPSSLAGIACETSTDCIGVTGQATSAGTVLSILPLHGTTPGAAIPAAGNPYLHAVACPSSTSCVAVGTDNAETTGVVTTISLAQVAQLAITTTILPPASVGVPYSATLASTGGTAPTVWSIASGSLPAGLSLDSATGVISGTPSETGSSFDVQVADAGRATSRLDPVCHPTGDGDADAGGRCRTA